MIVAQLVLCAVPDLAPLLARLRRLLRPKGRVLFLEHVPPRGEAGIVRGLARPFWRAVSSGCELEADVPAALRRAGFVMLDLERFALPTLTPPLRACAVGVARVVDEAA